MALTSDDFRNLQLSQEELTKATRDLLAAFQRGGGGPGGVSGAGGASPSPGGGPAQPPSVGGGGGGGGLKSDSAAAFGLSAARQVLQSDSGSSTGLAAGLLAGLARGGFTGAGAAAAAGIVQISQEYRGIHTAGREAARNAPLGSDLMTRDSYRRSAEQSQRMDFIEKYGSSSIFGFGFENGGGFTGKERAERANDQQRRFQAEQDERRFRPEDDAEATTFRQLAPLARGGASLADGPRGDPFRDLIAQFHRFNLERARNAQHLRESIRTIGSHINETTPGAQGQYGGK